MRGAVCCDACETPLTGGWSTGKYKKYAYYFCREKSCPLYGKTIAKKKIEGAFRALLNDMRPSEKLLELAKAMFKDAWDQKAAQVDDDAALLGLQLHELDQQIEKYAEKAVDAGNSRVLSAYEKRIADLETQKLLVNEKSRNLGTKRYDFDEVFELCARFLSSPCKIWDSGRFEPQRMVLRLGFSEHLHFCRENGFRAPKTTLPFKALGAISGGVLGDGAAGGHLKRASSHIRLRHLPERTLINQ